MFCYQKNFFNPTLPVDEAQFFALVRATQWNEVIDRFRETGDQKLKRGLPAFIFLMIEVQDKWWETDATECRRGSPPCVYNKAGKFYSIVTVVLLATVASYSTPVVSSAFEPQGNGKQVKQKTITDIAVRFLPWI